MNIKKIIFFTICSFLILFVASAILAANRNNQPLGLHLEGYQYPYPINYFTLSIEGKKLQMAYMNVLPSGKSRNQTVVLLHGGLAFGAYWKDTIKFLSEHGFRVIVPDQIGFGKSSKENIHYNLHLLAKNTNELLDHLGIHQKIIIIGHSLGGMLAVRFTLMYPEKVSKLILEDPLGLEDYRLKIAFKSTDEIVQSSLHPTWKNILNIHHALYADWKNKYAEYAKVAYRVSLNSKYSQIALIQALIYEMIYSEPIVYELMNIKIPTLLIFGYQDRTAPGKWFASKEIQKTLGNFPIMAKNMAVIVPNIQVKGFEKVGHVPHLEKTEQFNQTVINFLDES